MSNFMVVGHSDKNAWLDGIFGGLCGHVCTRLVKGLMGVYFKVKVKGWFYYYYYYFFMKEIVVFPSNFVAFQYLSWLKVSPLVSFQNFHPK